MQTHQDKIAIVTGAHQGIGFGVAETLASRGATVVIVDRQESTPQAARLGEGAIAIQADVTQEQSWTAVAEQVRQRFGRADILVNVAGVYPPGPIDTLSFEEWRHVLSTNLDAHFLAAKAIVPLLRQSKAGSIVSIGSDAVAMVTPPGMGFSHYMASKMGVVGLVRALASELAPDNITVNAVHPGITDTEGASGMPDDQKAMVYNQQAIKRVGTPFDVAGPVAFLTGPDARYVTGQALVADGGWMRL